MSLFVAGVVFGKFVWKGSLVVLFIVGEVSYVTRTNHACHFSWQAQYLVSLEGDIGCSAHCKRGFICHEDALRVSVFVTGAVLGEVQVFLSW